MNEPRNISLILVSPRVSENVGAAARVMKNFGLTDLRVVSPRDWSEQRALRMARKGSDILKNRRETQTLHEAVQDLTTVVATSARLGSTRAETTKSLSSSISHILESSRRIGIVFGPEERGLTNRELDICSTLLTIPTNPEFSSLNLAQAVAIACYEIHRCQNNPSSVSEMYPQKEKPQATVAEIESLFEATREFLLEVGFLNPQNPDAVLLHLRRLLSRAMPSSHDVSMLRGIFRQVRWYARHDSSQSG